MHADQQAEYLNLSHSIYLPQYCMAEIKDQAPCEERQIHAKITEISTYYFRISHTSATHCFHSMGQHTDPQPLQESSALTESTPQNQATANLQQKSGNLRHCSLRQISGFETNLWHFYVQTAKTNHTQKTGQRYPSEDKETKKLFTPLERRACKGGMCK